MRAVLVVCVLLGCVEDRTVPCGDERCPVGDVCTPGGCATPEAAAACKGLGDGTPCTTSRIASGACDGQACHPIVCGDGFVDQGEVCDDDNALGGDGCSATCNSDETCGNAVVDAVGAEECDVGIAGLSNDGCSSRCRAETENWRDVSPQPLEGRTDVGLAYDPDRARVVAFGGWSKSGLLGDTWEFDGSQWRQRHPAVAPSPRSGVAIAYDQQRHRVVVFGGYDATDWLDDTWEWDGAIWTRISTPTAPLPRAFARIVFDPVRGQLLLFGGLGDTTDTRTWLYTGTTWLELATTGSPPSCERFGMAYDEVANKVVIYCGPDDTWQLAGTTWTHAAPTTKPDIVGWTAMAWDPVTARVLLFGGFGTDGHDRSDLWSWSGTNWSKLAATGPQARESHGLTSFSGGMVLLGGANYFTDGLLGDTWRWTGTTWLPESSIPDQPPARYFFPMTYVASRGNVFVFGGYSIGLGNLDDTWEWSDRAWTELPRGPGILTPPARSLHAITYDSRRDCVVVFGGSNGGLLADTWEHDGSVWKQATPAMSPTARDGHAMAYDAARGVVVLFGGETAVGVPSAETWEYDGTIWTHPTPLVSPPARFAHAMAYDPVRGRVVMFGGWDRSVGYYGDTWEYDGTTWIDRTPPAPAPSPFARRYPAIAYDAGRQRVMLFGGNLDVADTWEWDGTSWSLREPTITPPTRYAHALTYDAVHHEIVVLGGVGANVYPETWAFSYASNQVPERCLLAAEDFDHDGRPGCDDPDCWGRCAPSCPPGAACSSMAPHCGDLVCNPVEDRLICPVDCP